MDVSFVIVVGYVGGVFDLVLSWLVIVNLVGFWRFKYVSWRLVLLVNRNYFLNVIL